MRLFDLTLSLPGTSVSLTVSGVFVHRHVAWSSRALAPLVAVLSVAVVVGGLQAPAHAVDPVAVEGPRSDGETELARPDAVSARC